MKYYLEQLTLFLFFMFINKVFYRLYDAFLIKNDTGYKELIYEKKMYVVKNLTKSTLLAFFSLLCAPRIYSLFFHHSISDWEITAWGSLYASTDFMGLLFVPNLPTTTKIHHTCVMVFAVFNIFVDHSKEGVHHALIVLTYFSCLPYLVNSLLAFRFLKSIDRTSQLAKLSFGIYGISIFCNFILQHIYVLYILEHHWYNYVYLLLYYLAILRDDIKLMKYLHFKSTESAS